MSQISRPQDASHSYGISSNRGGSQSGNGSSSYSFLSGIVKDVISNPVAFLNSEYQVPDSSETKVISEALFNKEPLGICENEVERLPYAPAGSIVCYITDDGRSRGDIKVCAYPFFSHLCLPVKVGEHVWVLEENTGGVSDYYWMTRKVTKRQSDDLNMTYLTRDSYIVDAYKTGPGPGANMALNATQVANLFAATSDQTAKTPMLPNQLTYNDLQASSLEYMNNFVQEPVPRKFTRTGADTLIQGSNNQFLQLTTEKFFNLEEEPSLKNFGLAADKSEKQTENKKKNVAFSGAIDIYVGHEKQRIREILDHESKNMAEVPKVEDGWNTILCKRDGNQSSDATNVGNHETDKITGLTGKPEYEKEGNDDPRNVFSRLYMSMNCSPDKKFELNTANADLEDLEANEQVATLLSYSDHTRILSENTLRMVKMSKEEDKKSSFLEMKDSGDIVIQAGEGENAAKIILYATGDICLVPGKKGLLHLGGDFNETSGKSSSNGIPLCGILPSAVPILKGAESNTASSASPAGPAIPSLAAGAYQLAGGTPPSATIETVGPNPTGAYSRKVMIKI